MRAIAWFLFGVAAATLLLVAALPQPVRMPPSGLKRTEAPRQGESLFEVTSPDRLEELKGNYRESP